MDCLVRDSTEHDMAEVHAIYRHHVLHSAASFDENPPSVGELTRRRADILGHGLPCPTWSQSSATGLPASAMQRRIVLVSLTATRLRTRSMSITAWAAAGLALLSFPPSSIVAKQAPGVR